MWTRKSAAISGLNSKEKITDMKRIVGSLATLALALSLGVAAYGQAAPKQNQPNNNQTAPMKKTSTKKHRKHTGHHKGHSKKKTTTKSTTPPKK